MFLIRQKVEVLQSVVIIGATGCGKTYLITFLVQMILRDNLVIKTLHSGITEDELSSFVLKAMDLATKEPEKKVWIFFDEFNTSPLQSLIQELVVSRSCNFSPEIRDKLQSTSKILPKNMVFVLICNPLRIKSSDTNVGLIHENATSAFTHRVYPIPETLLNYAWDFGQLTPEIEKKYIEPVFNPKKEIPGEPKLHPSESIIIPECISLCHIFLREKEGNNSVSLRDVQRVKEVYYFLLKFLLPLNLPFHKGYVLMCTIYLNYFLRIHKPQEEANNCEHGNQRDCVCLDSCSLHSDAHNDLW